MLILAFLRVGINPYLVESIEEIVIRHWNGDPANAKRASPSQSPPPSPPLRRWLCRRLIAG